MPPIPLLWVTSIVCLIPLALYICGRLRDPFHPLIFVGVLSFFVACSRSVFAIQPALAFVSPASLAYFFLVVAASVTAFYGGYILHWRIAQRRANSPPAALEFSPAWLLSWGTLYVAVGLAVYLYTRGDYEVTGYLRDLGALWVPGFILVLQAILMRRTYLPAGLVILAAAVVHPIDRFIIHGQRGDTFRLAVCIIPAFLYSAKRPARAIFIPAAVALALVMGVLQQTRTIIADGLAKNRVQALARVIEGTFSRSTPTYSGAEEHVYGAAMIETVRDTGQYNYGRFVSDLVVRFIPKEIVDKSLYYSPWSRTTAIVTTGEHAGYSLFVGAFPTGFAVAFVEFWWFTLVFWGALGYWMRKRYTLAIQSSRLDYQGYFVGLFIVLLYLLAQDLADFFMNMVYILLPLYLAYRLSRVRSRVSHEANMKFETVALADDGL